MQHRSHNGQYAPLSACGFTLIEMLITIAVASIVLSLAVPSFTGFIVTNRLTTQANEMVATINFARSEAVKRNAGLTFCRVNSADDTSCAAGAGNWEQWIVRTATGNVVRRGTVDTYGNTIMVRSTLSADQAAFGSDGLAWTGGALVDDHQISICSTGVTASNVRRVVLGTGSRISTRPDSGDC